MKINAIGSEKDKRCVSLTLTAESEIEEAILFEHLLKLRADPPELRDWYCEVLQLLQAGEMTPSAVAETLDLNNTLINNRFAHLLRLNLVARRAERCLSGGRHFVYWLNRRGGKEAPPCDILRGD